MTTYPSLIRLSVLLLAACALATPVAAQTVKTKTLQWTASAADYDFPVSHPPFQMPHGYRRYRKVSDALSSKGFYMHSFKITLSFEKKKNIINQSVVTLTKAKVEMEIEAGEGTEDQWDAIPRNGVRTMFVKEVAAEPIGEVLPIQGMWRPHVFDYGPADLLHSLDIVLTRDVTSSSYVIEVRDLYGDYHALSPDILWKRFTFDFDKEAPPAVTIARPLGQAKISGYAELEGTATDNAPILGVKYTIADASGKDVAGGNANLTTLPGVGNAKWNVDELFLPPGVLTLKVIAYNSDGEESAPVLRNFQVIPSSLQPGKFTAPVPKLSHEDVHMKPPPKALAAAISGVFSGARISATRLIAGGTVPNGPNDASGWWVASEITPNGAPVLVEPSGAAFYGANNTRTDPSLVADLGGSVRVPVADGLLMTKLSLIAPPLQHEDGFTLVYAFSIRFHNPFRTEARGFDHASVNLKLHVRYRAQDPTATYRIPSNAALLADLQSGDMAEIFSTSSILIYSDSPNALGSGWNVHEPSGAPVDAQLQDRWNRAFAETASLVNSAITTSIGQAKPIGHGKLTNFAFVARKRPADFITPVASFPVMAWRQHDERWIKEQISNIELNLWAAVTPALKGVSVVAGTGSATAPPPGADRTPPTVTITSHKNKQRLPFVSPLAVSGKAEDKVSVTAVEIRLEHVQAWTTAVLTPGPGPSVTWSAQLAGVRAGSNTLIVRSRDTAGNQSAESRIVVVLVRERTLAVAVTGQGSVSTGFAPSSAREAGVAYTITATPAKGWRFAGWSGAASSGDLKLTFRMPDANANLVATFIADNFASLAGTYDAAIGAGYADPENTGGVGVDFGRLIATVTPSGGVTAKLTLASFSPGPRMFSTLSAAGKLDGANTFTAYFTPKEKPMTRLRFVIEDGLCKGDLRVGENPVVQFYASPAATFSTAAPCSAAGIYNLVITAGHDDPLTNGMGWGQFIVSPLGKVTAYLYPSLQDKPATLVTAIQKFGAVQLAAELALGFKTAPSGVAKGYGAMLMFLPSDGSPGLLYGALNWMPLSPAYGLFPEASPGECRQLAMEAALYQPPPSDEPFFPSFFGYPNAVLRAFGAEVLPDTRLLLSIDETNMLIGAAPANSGATLKFDLAKGTFSGSCRIMGRTTAQSFKGIWHPDWRQAIGSLPGGGVDIGSILSTSLDNDIFASVERAISARTLSQPDIVVPSHRTARLGAVPQNFSMYLRIGTSATASQELIRQGSIGSAEARGWRLTCNRGNQRLRLELPGGQAIDATMSPQVSEIIVTREIVAEGCKVSLYVMDSVLISGNIYAYRPDLRGSLILPSSAPMQSDAPLIFADSFEGMIYRVRIWSRVLSASEMLDLLFPF